MDQHIAYLWSWLVEHALMVGDWLFGFDPHQRF